MLPFYLRSLPDSVYPSDVILSAQVGGTQGLSSVLEQNPVNITFNLVCTLQPCKHTLHTHACSTHTHTPHTYAPTHHTCTHTHTHRHTHMHTHRHTHMCTRSDLSAETHRRCARRQPQAVSSMTSTAPLLKRGMLYKLMFQCHVQCVSELVLCTSAIYILDTCTITV